MTEEKRIFRSSVADLIDFEPEENPPWRNNKLESPSMREMIEEIVQIRQIWDSLKGKTCDGFLDGIKRQLEIKFFYHCNVEEEHGLQSVDEIEKFLGRVEEGLSKGNESLPFKEQETVNLRDAYLYLKSEAESIEHRGLLEESMLRQVNKITLRNITRHKCHTKAGSYSNNPRVTQFGGETYFYQQPDDMQQAVCLLLDRFNSLFTDSINKTDEVDKLQGIFKSVAFLVYELLDLHPFSDGNGRLCRLLCSYVLSTLTPFPSPIYNMHSESCKNDFVNALVNTRKSKSRHPRELTTMIIESNWASWIHLKKSQKVEDLNTPKSLDNDHEDVQQCSQDTCNSQKSHVHVTERYSEDLRASLAHTSNEGYVEQNLITSYA